MNLLRRDIYLGRSYEAYTQSLREFSTLLYRDLDIPTSAKLLVTCGATGAIDAAMSLFSPGQTIVMMPYEYFDAVRMARSRGLTIVRSRVGGAGNDIDALVAKIHECLPRVCYLSLPNNPSGMSYKTSDLKKIIHSMGDGWIIIDQTLMSEKTISISWFMENAGKTNIVVIGSFSKTRGLIGERIGYLVSSGDISSLSTYAHAPAKLSIEAVRKSHRSRFMKRAARRIVRNDTIISNWAGKQDSCAWSGSSTNFGILHTKTSSTHCAEALIEHGISVKTQRELECEGNFLRFDLTMPPRTTKRALKIIESILDDEV